VQTKKHIYVNITNPDEVRRIVASGAINAATIKTGVVRCNCTGACRELGYCPCNPPQRPPAMRPEEV
jgi:hypothetical protein